MRSAIAVLPFVAAALAADTTSKDYTLVPELSGSVTVTSTYRYSNPATKYLTETNSDGVVTGMPSNTFDTVVVTTQPNAVTTQPPVATVPAGVSGTRIITYNGTAGITSFTVVGEPGQNTTSVIGNVATAGSSSGAAGQTTGKGASPTSGGNGNGNGGNGNGNGGSGSSSASASSSSGAAVGNMHLASGGLVGLAAFFAALL